MKAIGTVLLGLLWAVLVGSFSLASLAIGLAIGFVTLELLAGARRPAPFRRLKAAIGLFLFSVLEIIKSNARVAWYTVSSLRRLEPAVLAVPVRPDLSNGELSLLAVLVTLTPGTLSLDLSDDRRVLYVHFMHVDDPEAAIRSIVDGFERRILELRS